MSDNDPAYRSEELTGRFRAKLHELIFKIYTIRVFNFYLLSKQNCHTNPTICTYIKTIFNVILATNS